MANTEWTTEDTKLWIHDQYTKLEDMAYYLKTTTEWLEDRGIQDHHIVFVCSFMTIIWVNQLRGSVTTKREIFELLDLPQWEEVVDQLYVLPASYVEMDLEHTELLELIIRNKIRI